MTAGLAMRSFEGPVHTVGVVGCLAFEHNTAGYAPQPVTLARALARPVLACGAELKNTICVAKGRHAFLSHRAGTAPGARAPGV